MRVSRSARPRSRPAPPAPPALATLAAIEGAESCAWLASTPDGLSTPEAARRLARDGPNDVGTAPAESAWRPLARAIADPLILLLLGLAAVAQATGDHRAAGVIALMIAAGVLLRFVQEHRASRAVARLRAMIPVTAAVARDGTVAEHPIHELVAGDVIRLHAGDMVPADVRLLASKDLFVNQATLTGEALPVEKHVAPDARADVPVHERTSTCLFGTSVLSGTATAIVVATGGRTAFGQVAAALAEAEPPTAFDRGVQRFTWLMLRLIAVLVPLVFVLTGLTKHDWREALLFALAVAVGLAPEMLPAVISVSLAGGALRMAARRVVVKHLDAMQNVGAMDVLCTDKTGTLTMDQVLLETHCDLEGRESERVLQAAWTIAHFQTGLRNVLDEAILAHAPPVAPHAWRKRDEIPFDFARRLMSVVVARDGEGSVLLAKGAPEALFARCTLAERDGARVPFDAAQQAQATARYDALSDRGFRVLAVAERPVPAREAYAAADEAGLCLLGFVGFVDPPKESAAPALATLAALGVRVVILTGDNARVSRAVCANVGLPVGTPRLGPDLDALDDAALAQALRGAALCARLTPLQKARIIRVLQGEGHVVGFLGDGINDAPALRAADVGISVDTAVDVARASADLVLLEKSLLVLCEGVREGRRTFANILKYVRMGASSNVGNMLSMVGASALFPFIPMAPLQILANNLLYDLSQLAIPADRVDDEDVAGPRPWAMRPIARFIAVAGPVSSAYDYAIFALLWWGLGARTVADAARFQTGWFVASLCTQTLVIHVIRTGRVPFVRSRAAWPLVLSTVAAVAVGCWLPWSPWAATLGFVPLPPAYWAALAVLVPAYLATTWGVTALARRHGLP